jgi:hypothetical protein
MVHQEQGTLDLYLTSNAGITRGTLHSYLLSTCNCQYTCNKASVLGPTSGSFSYKMRIMLFSYLYRFGDRLYGLVVRVSWLQIQRSRVRFPALPDVLRSRWSGTGSTQPREDN